MEDRGLMIVFEGIDRCGKSTQTKILSKKLNNSKLINFPKRDTIMGGIIDNYLKGKTNLNKEFLHKLFSVNRWELKEEMENLIYYQKKNLIIDRYSYSGIAYSIANGLDKEWCKLSEIGLLKPDIIFYLKIDIEEAKKRSDYGNEIYEKEEFQIKVKEIFEKDLLLKEDNICIINVNNKSKEDISEIIINYIKNYNKRGNLEKLWN